MARWKSVKSSTNQWCTQGAWDRLPGCTHSDYTRVVPARTHSSLAANMISRHHVRTQRPAPLEKTDWQSTEKEPTTKTMSCTKKPDTKNKWEKTKILSAGKPTCFAHRSSLPMGRGSARSQGAVLAGQEPEMVESRIGGSAHRKFGRAGLQSCIVDPI